MSSGTATGWTPESTDPENAVSLLSEIASARKVPTPRPADGEPPAAPPPVTAAQLLASAPVLDKGTVAGLPPAQVPSSPGFSPDGLWWWDGHRWVPSGATEDGVRDVPRRRRGRPAVVWAGVVALVLGLATLAAAPVLWDGRSRTTDQVLQEALLHAAGAQQRHLVDHGTYTSDGTVLDRYVAQEPGMPAGVRVQVHRADAMTFCLSAATPGSRGLLWLSESGEVSAVPCL